MPGWSIRGPRAWPLHRPPCTNPSLTPGSFHRLLLQAWVLPEGGGPTYQTSWKQDHACALASSFPSLSPSSLSYETQLTTSRSWRSRGGKRPHQPHAQVSPGTTMASHMADLCPLPPPNPHGLLLSSRKLLSSCHPPSHPPFHTTGPALARWPTRTQQGTRPHTKHLPGHISHLH